MNKLSLYYKLLLDISLNSRNSPVIIENNSSYENNILKIALDKYEKKFYLLNKKLQENEKINQNLFQDIKLYKIHFKNLKSINMELTRTIKNLQGYREYVMQLILKKNRANYKIKKLIIAIKNMQTIIKQKNTVIKRINLKNNKLFLQNQHFIRNNCINT